MNLKNISLDIVIISIAFVFLISVGLVLVPDLSLQIINSIFKYVALIFGTPLLWFSFLCTALCIFLAFSSFGHIKLGDGKPDYSTFSYIGMMICAGLASASVYFSFIEWVFFYNTPALGIEAKSTMALEWAPSFSFMYWGINSWPPFAIAALPIAISYYKRGNKGLRFSIVWEDLFNLKSQSISGKIIDILFIITTLGGLSVTLGLGIPLISNFISFIFDIPDGFFLQFLLIILIAIIFSFSSYMGISKGMKIISDLNIYLAIIFVFFILVLGPTFFIFKYITNGFGIFLQNYIQILFATSPIEADGFSEQWTIFYIALAVAYAPLMSLFITKISKGRTIREMLLCTVLGGSFGCIVLFGINGGFSVYAQSTGILNIAFLHETQSSGNTILAIISLLPIPSIITVIALVVLLTLFLATSLDTASFSLAAVVTKNLGQNDNPSPFLRLFWCILLALIPLALIVSNAPFSAIQTVCLVTAIPFSIVIIIFIIRSIKWLNKEKNILTSNKDQ